MYKTKPSYNGKFMRRSSCKLRPRENRSVPWRASPYTFTTQYPKALPIFPLTGTVFPCQRSPPERGIPLFMAVAHVVKTAFKEQTFLSDRTTSRLYNASRRPFLSFFFSPASSVKKWGFFEERVARAIFGSRNLISFWALLSKRGEE